MFRSNRPIFYRLSQRLSRLRRLSESQKVIFSLEGIDIPLNGTLLSCIKEGNNDEAISILKNANAGRLTINEEVRVYLYYAAYCNNSVIMQYIIDKGVNSDGKRIVEDIPLMMDIYAKRDNAMSILLESRVIVVERFKIDQGLSIFNRIQKINLNILKMMLDTVVSECSNNNDKAQKLLDVRCPFPAVIILKNAELTKSLLERGCSVHDRLPKTDETALHLAVRLLDVDNVKLLAESGSEIDAKDNENDTPLSRFDVFSEDPDEKLEILRFLLDRGSSLTAESSIVKTVGSQLLRYGDSRTVRVLTSYIDLTMRDESGYYTYLHDLAWNTNSGVFEVLRGKIFDINARDDHGMTLLDKSVSNSVINVSNVQFLLEHGADVNGIGDDGVTVLERVLNDPIHKFIVLETRRVLELLLQYGMALQFEFTNNVTIFKCIPSDQFDFAKPIFAHLAMLQSFDKPIIKDTLDGIESTSTFKEYFNLCKQQIEQMKSTSVYESIKLYELLREDKKKLTLYARNHDFLPNYGLCMKNNVSNLDLYYISTLQLRVGKAFHLSQMREKAALIICEMIGLPTSMSRTIAYDIVEYLDYKDLENMAINVVQMREKAALIICKISGLPIGMSRTIGHNIVQYLDYKDLENMLEI